MPSGGMVREKVVSYLAGLTPDARSMLLRRLETSERGNKLDPDGRLILDVARNIGAPAAGTPSAGSQAVGPQAVDARAIFFAPFDRFVIDEELPVRQSGWVLRSSLDSIWVHLTRDLMPVEFRPFAGVKEVPDAAAAALFEKDLETLRNRALDLLVRLKRDTDPDSREHRRLVAHMGGDSAFSDLEDLLSLRERLPVIARLLGRVPMSVMPGEASERLLAEQVSVFLEARPAEACWLGAALMERFPNPYLLARLAAACARSEDVVEIRRQGAGPFVDLALGAAERIEIRLRHLFDARADADAVLAELKTFHDLIRGTTTAIKIEDDKAWRARVAAVRRSVSGMLSAEFDGLVQKIRFALRSDDRHTPSEDDRRDAHRAVAIFAAAKRYRGALALNDLLMRLDPTIVQALEVYSRDLIDLYRKARGTRREELAAGGRTLIAMTELMLGEEHAAVLRRAWDKAQKTTTVNPFA